MWIAWTIRLVLLLGLLPFLVPFHVLSATFAVAPIPVALFLLALALMALAGTLGLILGVLGTLIDVLIVVLLLGIAWHWPRGLRAPLSSRIRLAFRGLRNALGRELRCCSATDAALCLAVVLLALVLSLSSGLLHFALSVAVVLLIVGVVWKWPRSPHLPVLRKLALALRALWADVRRRFRH